VNVYEARRNRQACTVDDRVSAKRSWRPNLFDVLAIEDDVGGAFFRSTAVN